MKKSDITPRAVSEFRVGGELHDTQGVEPVLVIREIRMGGPWIVATPRPVAAITTDDYYSLSVIHALVSSGRMRYVGP